MSNKYPIHGGFKEFKKMITENYSGDHFTMGVDPGPGKVAFVLFNEEKIIFCSKGKDGVYIDQREFWEVLEMFATKDMIGKYVIERRLVIEDITPTGCPFSNDLDKTIRTIARIETAAEMVGDKYYPNFDFHLIPRRTVRNYFTKGMKVPKSADAKIRKVILDTFTSLKGIKEVKSHCMQALAAALYQKIVEHRI